MPTCRTRRGFWRKRRRDVCVVSHVFQRQSGIGQHASFRVAIASDEEIEADWRVAVSPRFEVLGAERQAQRNSKRCCGGDRMTHDPSRYHNRCTPGDSVFLWRLVLVELLGLAGRGEDGARPTAPGSSRLCRLATGFEFGETRGDLGFELVVEQRGFERVLQQCGGAGFVMRFVTTSLWRLGCDRAGG